jgi:mannose-1-phosphate guanylyltransferase
MRAVVLVGGFGTRLRPLTNSIPKPMLPVGHVPIIERLVANLHRGGVTQVTLALGFKPEPFLAAFPDGLIGDVEVVYAVEPEPLDTAGAIRFAADFAGIDDTFLVANGDILTDLDIAALVDFHRGHHAEATLHLTAVDNPSAFGVVDLAGDGCIRCFVEKPAPGTEPSRLINAGTYVMEPSVLQLIPAGQRVSVERDTFPRLVERGSVFAMATDDYWLDTGTVPLYLQANLDVLSLEHVEAVHPDARVDATAVIQRSVLAPRATVGEHARVTRSVILDGVRIGAGAVVTDSVVMGEVGPGATVIDSVVGSEGHVAAGQRLTSARLPAPEPA